MPQGYRLTLLRHETLVRLFFGVSLYSSAKSFLPSRPMWMRKLCVHRSPPSRSNSRIVIRYRRQRTSLHCGRVSEATQHLTLHSKHYARKVEGYKHSFAIETNT